MVTSTPLLIWLLTALSILWWLFFGLIYVSEVRRHRRDGKLELKFWVAGLLLGPLVILFTVSLWAWLVLTGAVTRVLNHRL